MILIIIITKKYNKRKEISMVTNEIQAPGYEKSEKTLILAFKFFK